jgi:hypothetical protein
MATDTNAVEIRRENLRRLIKDKFDNKRADFARAADIQPNQVNLMLSDNPLYRRPVSEDTARRIERNLSLANGYFDQIPQNNAPEGLKNIMAMDVPSELEPVIITSTSLGRITITESWLKRHHITDLSRVWLVESNCDGMDPEIRIGDHMVVEWLDSALPADKTFSRDGCYILMTRTGPVLRRVQRTLSEYVISSPNGLYTREEKRDLKGIKLQARVISKLAFD